MALVITLLYCVAARLTFYVK